MNLLFSCLLTVLLFHSPALHAAECVMTGDPFLWKVDGPAGPTHLFGTIHVGIPVSKLDAAVGAAFSQAGTVVMESVDDPDAKPDLSTLFPPKGQTLNKLLSKKAWKKLKKIVGKEISEDELKSLKPLDVLPLLVHKSEIPKDQEVRPEMDNEIEENARKSGKKLAGLENGGEVLRAAERIFTAERISAMLEAASASDILSVVDSRLKDVYQRYCSGQITDPETAAGDGDDFTESIDELLVKERNKNWLPKIEAYIAAGGAFIAVGVGHFEGPSGLLTLLTAKGYSVMRVKARQTRPVAFSAPLDGQGILEALNRVNAHTVFSNQ